MTEYERGKAAGYHEALDAVGALPHDASVPVPETETMEAMRPGAFAIFRARYPRPVESPVAPPQAQDWTNQYQNDPAKPQACGKSIEVQEDADER